MQVHGLKSKLALSKEKLLQQDRNIASKQDQLGAIKQKLQKEQKEADELKIKLHEEIREKVSLQVRFILQPLLVIFSWR